MAFRHISADRYNRAATTAPLPKSPIGCCLSLGPDPLPLCSPHAPILVAGVVGGGGMSPMVMPANSWAAPMPAPPQQVRVTVRAACPMRIPSARHGIRTRSIAAVR